MPVFLQKYGENRHKKCNLNNWETKLFAHKWKLHHIAGFYHKREMMSEQFFVPCCPALPPKEKNESGWACKNIIFVSKELMWCGERTDRGQVQGNSIGWGSRGRQHEVHLRSYRWPCISHLTPWDLSLSSCTLLIYGMDIIFQKWLW